MKKNGELPSGTPSVNIKAGVNYYVIIKNKKYLTATNLSQSGSKMEP